MSIIFVCSVPFGGGERLAKSLAQKLGYAYLSREDVVARANEAGIPVGKLEMAMVKKPAVQERMARLKDRYLAVATATICEKAQQGSLVYYGRAGHHLLPGVSHVLRVHIVPEHGQRVDAVMARLKLTREKAEQFLRDIDGDIRSWVRFVHGVEMDAPSRYDFVINLENVSLENASVALCSIADFPDFKPTPASQKAMGDRLLQARARIRLTLDGRTAEGDLTVRASDGVLTITYVPQQANLAPVIPEVIGDLPGCREIRCTRASTSVLWIQEEFRHDSEAFREVSEIARRWGAAVELLRYKAECVDEPGDTGRGETLLPSPTRACAGGVEEDLPESRLSMSDRRFQEALEALVTEGRSGGGQTVCGTREKLLAAINPTIAYSLVAVGDLFLEKTAAARTRMTREVTRFLSERIKAPILSTSDLRERLRFGPKELLELAGALLLVVLIYAGVFANQGEVSDVFGGAYHKAHPWVAPVAVAMLAPLVAGLYGMLAAALLKSIKLE